MQKPLGEGVTSEGAPPPLQHFNASVSPTQHPTPPQPLFLRQLKQLRVALSTIQKQARCMSTPTSKETRLLTFGHCTPDKSATSGVTFKPAHWICHSHRSSHFWINYQKRSHSATSKHLGLTCLHFGANPRPLLSPRPLPVE